jgi:hypothetical protein
VALLAILLQVAVRCGLFTNTYVVLSRADAIAIIVLNFLLPLFAIPLGVWGLLRPGERNRYAATGLLLSSAQLLSFGALLVHEFTRPF